MLEAASVGQDSTDRYVPKENKIGVSYSGGGPLLLLELGIAKAFVKKKIRPNSIAGVSAGALTATAHALDTKAGSGIDAAIEILKDRVSSRQLDLTLTTAGLHMLGEALTQGVKSVQAIATNARTAPMINELLDTILGPRGGSQMTFADFQRQVPEAPTLLVAATNLQTGEACWFSGEQTPQVLVADALVASSAIPAIFPPKTITHADGTEREYVDGGVTCNQPLGVLAAKECCEVMYSCAAGYDDSALPTNLLDILQHSYAVTIHHSSVLEMDYVQRWMGAKGQIYHIHPNTVLPKELSHYDFSHNRELVGRVFDAACVAAEACIDGCQLPSSPACPFDTRGVIGPWAIQRGTSAP